MTYQSIPKFSTTLNDHPVFIPAMVWHLPAHTLPQAAEALRDIDEKSFDGAGVCRAATKALEFYTEGSLEFYTEGSLEFYTEGSLDVYRWVGRAVCYFDHSSSQQAEEAWLEQYFQHRFGLCGRYQSTSVVHYTREQITALRLAWLEHIATHLEAAAK